MAVTGRIAQVIAVVTVFVTGGILGAFGLKLMAEFSTGLSNPNATSAINYAVQGILTLFQYWPIVALAVVAGIVISVIFGLFGGGRARKRGR